MESKAKLFGHPIHPMLIVLPLGLFIMAVVIDVAYLATERIEFAMVAYYNIGAGILTGLFAAVFGAIDWWAIPSGTRAKSVGLWHGVGNVVVVALFAVSWWLRSATPDYAPDTLAFSLGALGLVLGTVTGWLGGELVDRLGVGVDDGAHLNSPNSLSGRPAHEGGTTRRPV
jgi:uncharacterized membrane protein